MLQKIDQNNEINEIIQDREKEHRKLASVLSHLAKNPHQAKSIFLKMDVSDNTRKEYASRINQFLAFCEYHPITLDIFLDFKKELSTCELKTSSKNKYLGVARIFLRELVRQGFIKDPTLNVRLFKCGIGHKKFGHTSEEVKKITRFLDNSDNTPEFHRMKAIFYLAAMHGLRQVEIARLGYDDVDLFSGHLNIIGKGRDDKERVYISEKTIDVLKTYMDSWKIHTGSLFISTSNRSKGKRLSTWAIRQIYKKLKISCGTNASMHGFRHFFTTEMIKKNIPLNTVQKFTRHKSLNMLQVYNDEIILKDESSDIYDKVFSKYTGC